MSFLTSSADLAPVIPVHWGGKIQEFTSLVTSNHKWSEMRVETRTHGSSQTTVDLEDGEFAKMRFLAFGNVWKAIIGDYLVGSRGLDTLPFAAYR